MSQRHTYSAEIQFVQPLELVLDDLVLSPCTVENIRIIARPAMEDIIALIGIAIIASSDDSQGTMW